MAASARGRGAGERVAAARLLRRGWEWLPGPGRASERASGGEAPGGWRRRRRRRGSPFVCAVPKWLRPGRAALPRPGRAGEGAFAVWRTRLTRWPPPLTYGRGYELSQKVGRFQRISSFHFFLKQIPGGKAPYSEPRYGHHESDAWSCPLPLKLTQVSRASCLQNSSMTHGQQ